MLVLSQLAESLLAKGQKAERRTFRAVRQDAQVPHGPSEAETAADDLFRDLGGAAERP
jgi:hypothetical protein